MKYSFMQAAGWFCLYVLLILSPMLLAWSGPGLEGRGFWVEFGVALGFVGLGMLCLQFLITGRYRNFAMGFGSDNILHFHTATGVVGMILVLAHPIVLFLADSQYLAYLDPSVNFLRVMALVPATVAVVLVVVLSLWRKKFRLIYEWWRLSHGALALFVVFVGLVHVLQVGHHTDLWWQKVYVVLFVGAAMFLIVHVRVIKPYIINKYPYRVVDVVQERADAITLEVEANDHHGMRFNAGQYAWITLGDSPYSLQQHPFSFSSSATEPKKLSFTSKPLGDFTATWKDVQPGTKVFLEGPYGAFTIDWVSNYGAVFAAGGVGITPIMSMLRTLAANGDTRACVLFYANKTWDGIIFREEIEELEKKLNLKVVHVLEEPPDDWEGESGYLEPDILKRHLPEDVARQHYYICGPEPMMNLVESELVKLDIPLPQIMSERFEIV